MMNIACRQKRDEELCPQHNIGYVKIAAATY